jgi:hypothetical protein
MPYDSSKDECIKIIGVTSGVNEIEVGLWSYNKGKPKVSMLRKGIKRSGEPWTSSIGRISKEELEALLPLLHEAKKILDTY